MVTYTKLRKHTLIHTFETKSELDPVFFSLVDKNLQPGAKKCARNSARDVVPNRTRRRTRSASSSDTTSQPSYAQTSYKASGNRRALIKAQGGRRRKMPSGVSFLLLCLQVVVMYPPTKPNLHSLATCLLFPFIDLNANIIIYMQHIELRYTEHTELGSNESIKQAINAPRPPRPKGGGCCSAPAPNVNLAS